MLGWTFIKLTRGSVGHFTPGGLVYRLQVSHLVRFEIILYNHVYVNTEFPVKSIFLGNLIAWFCFCISTSWGLLVYFCMDSNDTLTRPHEFCIHVYSAICNQRGKLLCWEKKSYCGYVWDYVGTNDINYIKLPISIQ